MMSVIDEKQHTLEGSEEFVTPSFEDAILTPEYQFYDISIGCLLVLCSIVGFSGNTFSLFHFLNETPKTLSTKLYIAICSIDIISSTISIPVILVLFNKRSDNFGFGNHIFCAIWYGIVLFLQQMSMYLVMLLSLSRAIVIVSPFYRIHRNLLIMTIPVYTVYLSIQLLRARPGH